MADDPNPALRAALEAHLATVTDQIDDLEELNTGKLTDASHAVIAAAIDERRRRQGLTKAALDSFHDLDAKLENLDLDGYPSLEKEQVLGSIAAEIQEQKASVAAGADIFEAEPAVSGGTVTVPPFTDPPVA